MPLQYVPPGYEVQLSPRYNRSYKPARPAPGKPDLEPTPPTHRPAPPMRPAPAYNGRATPRRPQSARMASPRTPQYASSNKPFSPRATPMQAWQAPWVAKHRWMTTHDQAFVNHVGNHPNLMDPDDWTPETAGIRTMASIEKDMLEMDPNVVRQMLTQKLVSSNIFFTKPVAEFYCLPETGGGIFPAEKKTPRPAGAPQRPPWRRATTLIPEGAPMGKAHFKRIRGPCSFD